MEQPGRSHSKRECVYLCVCACRSNVSHCSLFCKSIPQSTCCERNQPFGCEKKKGNKNLRHLVSSRLPEGVPSLPTPSADSSGAAGGHKTDTVVPSPTGEWMSVCVQTSKRWAINAYNAICRHTGGDRQTARLMILLCPTPNGKSGKMHTDRPWRPGRSLSYSLTRTHTYTRVLHQTGCMDYFFLPVSPCARVKL